jgi:hypothetical protein
MASATKVLLKNFKRPLRYIFKKYANSGSTIKRNTFDGVSGSSNKISLTSLWSFRRDFLDQLITK